MKFKSGGAVEQVRNISSGSPGTTTLTTTDRQIQNFAVGTFPQTIVLPDATTMAIGQKFEIYNSLSTGQIITIQYTDLSSFTPWPKLTTINSGVSIKLVDNSTANGLWVVQSVMDGPLSFISTNGANGYGSSNIFARRYSSVISGVGIDITYADSATAGTSFTINTAGVYAISRSDSNSGSGVFGISRNGDATASILTSPTNDAAMLAATSFNNTTLSISWTDYFFPGDVIRPHDSASSGAVNNADFKMTVVRVS